MAKIIRDFIMFLNGCAFGLSLVLVFAAVAIGGDTSTSMGWAIAVSSIMFIVSGAVLVTIESKRK